MKYIQDIKDLKGKKVLLRVDFNVALNAEGAVDSNEDWRIKRSMPTIQFLVAQGAKIILISHIGREKEGTLLPVVQYINQHFPIFIAFIPDITGETVAPEIESMEDGDILMLENLRRDPREENNDEGFAKELSSLADIYVNDAFAVCHRAHASVVGIPQNIQSYAGLLLQDEIQHLSFEKEKHPFLVILGGAKLETKMPLIEKYLTEADNVFVGGALANEIFKSKGFEIGESLVGGYAVSDVILNNEKLMYPKDVVARVTNSSILNAQSPTLEIGSQGLEGNNERMCESNEVSQMEMIVDLGEKSLNELTEKAKSAQRILWNGPLGLEDSQLVDGTRKLLRALAQQQTPQGPTLRSGVEIIIGGGDTVAVVQELGLIDSFLFVSTGGGAMLEYLEKGTLIGLEALESKKD